MYGSLQSGWESAGSSGTLASVPGLSQAQVERLHVLGVDSIEDLMGVLESGSDAEVRLAAYLDLSVERLDVIVEAVEPASPALDGIPSKAKAEPVDSAGTPRAPLPYGTGALEHINDSWPYAGEPVDQTKAPGVN